MQHTRRRGFTLIEISVVLVIALIISSITFGAFRSVTDGNKRTNCQSNLSQIYQSCRLYAQDYNGQFPYLNTDEITVDAPPVPSVSANHGLGLWALYSYRDEKAEDCALYNPNLPSPDSEPNSLTGYVRSPKVFHCPSDDYKRTISYRPTSTAACTTAEALSSQLNFNDSSGVLHRNPYYLSYQNAGDNDATSILPNATYSSYRGDSVKRQLTYYVGASLPERPIGDATVVTWCRFHRSLDRTGTTTNINGRTYDNVLFSDGSVQNLPAQQHVTDTLGNKADCVGWQRVPRGQADYMKKASTCTP
jgi:prepilin-type N-terminal cleavage/methylation domain-containing protein